MKAKIFLLAGLLLSSVAAVEAQVYTVPLAAGDTVVNTATISKTFNVTGDFKGIVVNPFYSKISGTVAGTIKLQASVDGVTFTDVASQTFSATDVASNQTLWYVAAPLAMKYKVTWTGTGTMSAVLGLRYRVNK